MHQSKLELSSGGGEGKAGLGGAGKGGRSGAPAGTGRGVSLPEAFFTVDDARALLTVRALFFVLGGWFGIYMHRNERDPPL